MRVRSLKARLLLTSKLRRERSDLDQTDEKVSPARRIFPQLKSYQTTSVDSLIYTRGADIGTRDP